MTLYVLSRRAILNATYYDILYDLEDLIVRTCEGRLLVPTAKGLTQWARNQRSHPLAPIVERVARRVGKYNPPPGYEAAGKSDTLLLITIDGAELALFSSIPNWRDRFGTVVAYVYDGWSYDSYPSYIRQLDHLFTTTPELQGKLHDLLKIPISCIPFGADVLKQGTARTQRPIDLMSYGRLPEGHGRAMVRGFNEPGSGFIYYRTLPRVNQDFPSDVAAARQEAIDYRNLLFKMLRRCRLALAFDSLYQSKRYFPCSVVTPRWFESGGAGCAIVGKRPTSPLGDQLMDWPDAVIDIPDDPDESVQFLKDLLKDQARLDAIHQRNYKYHLARNDWRWRVKDMITTLDLPVPEPLQAELTACKQKAQGIAIS